MSGYPLQKGSRFPLNNPPTYDRAGRGATVTSSSRTIQSERKVVPENDQLKMPATLFGKKGSRRDFLRNTAATALAGGALAACSVPDSGAQVASKSNNADHSGGTMAPNPAPVSVAAAAEAMDRMHEAGVKAFPAKTAGKGNQLMKPRMDKGVKVFDLTAKQIRWETTPGQTVEAWVYNDQLPGPQIRVREGDRVRLTLKNELPESTAVHFHGVEVPNDQDGVPFITQPVDQIGSELYLRVHGAQSGLAHVPLSPQCREAGWTGIARRVHHRAERSGADRKGRHRLRADPERRHARLHLERQELSGHRAARRQSSARSFGSAS